MKYSPMKTFFLTIICCVVTYSTLLAQRYFTRTGHISFYASTPLEDIKADNGQVASIIDLSNGDMAFSVLMKSFVFPKALMQEHFNENYIESDKYAKATFKGKI